MEQRLKERLIGAAILVALAVWLIPWILDGRAPPQDKTTSVPLQLPTPKQSAPQRTQTIDLGVPNGASPVVAGNDAAAAAAAGPPGAPAQAADAGAQAAGGNAQAAGGAPADAGGAQASAPAKTPTARADGGAAAPRPQARSQPAAQPPTKTSPAPQAKLARAAPQTQPAAAGAGGPEWMVQLGSFGERDNAQRLAQRVAGVGFHAEISTHKSDGQLLYRVRVGPKATRNAAEAAANALSAHGFVAQVVTAD